jgi:hypothetical protein
MQIASLEQDEATAFQLAWQLPHNARLFLVAARQGQLFSIRWIGDYSDKRIDQSLARL